MKLVVWHTVSADEESYVFEGTLCFFVALCLNRLLVPA
jgi:hypothetical protein